MDPADVCIWHEADVLSGAEDFRFQGQSCRSAGSVCWSQF